MTMLQSLLILLVVFTIGNAAGHDGGDHGGNDHRGDGHGSVGGDSHRNDGGDHGGDSHRNDGGDHGADSHRNDGGDHGADSHRNDGGDHGADSHRNDGWDSHRGHSGCPSGWKNFGSQCYKYFSQRVNWINAERSCQYLGGNLASVSSKPENDFLLRLVPTSTRCWIGAYDAVVDGEWMWSDGSSSSYRNWCSGEPNNYGGREDCVELSFTGNRCWNDASCSTMMGFICAI